MPADNSVKTRFLTNVAQHQMTIELDNGCHRSILFKRPGSSAYYFRLNTWPGYLCISGDMGTYVFRRLEDMFEFFREDRMEINVGYWTEKLTAIDGGRSGGNPIKEFSAEDTARSIRLSYKGQRKPAGFAEALKSLKGCSNDDEAAEVLQEVFHDYYEYFSYNPTFRIQWIFYAIVWGILQYDAVRLVIEKHPELIQENAA